MQSAITAISQEVSEVNLGVYAAGNIILQSVGEMDPSLPRGTQWPIDGLGQYCQV